MQEDRTSASPTPLLLGAPAEFCLPVLGEFRDALLEALSARRDVEIDLRGVSELDVGGMQLLCAAHQAFTRSGLNLRLLDPSSAAVQTFRVGGFEASHGTCPVGSVPCMWELERGR